MQGFENKFSQIVPQNDQEKQDPHYQDRTPGWDHRFAVLCAMDFGKSMDITAA